MSATVCQTCDLHGVEAIVKEEGKEIEVIACPRCRRILRRLTGASK